MKLVVGFCRRGRKQRRRSGELCRRGTTAAGAEVLPGAADVWARADIIFKVRPPTLDEVGMLREGRDADRLRLAGAAPRADGSLAGAQGHRARDRLPAPAAEPRAEDGRPVVHGRHQRLPRSGRGGERIRPLLQWPDHRRGQDPAGPGSSIAGLASPAWRPSARLPTWARSCAPTTPVPRSPTRWCRSVASSSRSITTRKAGRRRLREGDERGLPGQRAMYARPAKPRTPTS